METLLLTLLAVGLGAAVGLALITRRSRSALPAATRWALLLHPLLYVLSLLYAGWFSDIFGPQIEIKMIAFHALLLSAVVGSLVTFLNLKYTAWVGVLCVAEVLLVVPLWFLGVLALGT